MAPQLKPPIFLIGNVRSGTTMMQNLFALHPQVVAWFEPRTIWMYADPGRHHDRFDAGDATPRVKRYIRKRFLGFQERNGGLRIMEKTPSNVLRIPYVDAIFPEARYLYIVREPLANLSSAELKWRLPIHRNKLWRRLKETPKTQLHHYAARYLVDHFRVRVLRKRHVSVWGVRYPGIYDDLKQHTPEQVIAKQWVESSRVARSDLAMIEPERVMQIRYEDFVENPGAGFPAILEHFGLSSTPEIDKAVRATVDPSRQDKWRRLDRETISACLPILKGEMGSHGYDVPDDYRGILAD